MAGLVAGTGNFLNHRAGSGHGHPAGAYIAFPTLLDIVGEFFVLVVGIAVVYLLSRLLKLRPAALLTEISRRDLTHVLLVGVGTISLIALYRVVFHTIVVPALGWEHTQLTLDPVTFLFDVILAAVGISPLLILMWRTGMSLGSIGVRREKLGGILILGIIPSTIYVALVVPLATQLGLRFAGFFPEQTYAVVAFLLLAGVEEIVWRGYIQTRLVAWAGGLNGLALTSLVFSLAHFPVRFFLFSGAVPEAFVGALLIFPFGLLLGFFMLRSQNIIPGTLFHAVSNMLSVVFFQPAAS